MPSKCGHSFLLEPLRQREFFLPPTSLIILCFYPTVCIKANKSFSEEVLKKLWTNSKLLALKQVNTYIAFRMYIKHISLGLVTRKRWTCLLTMSKSLKFSVQAIPNDASVALSSKQYRIYANALKNPSLKNYIQAGY